MYEAAIETKTREPQLELTEALKLRDSIGETESKMRFAL